MSTTPHVAVVGGGVAGLAAAYDVLRLHPTATVSVLEAAREVGGKLRSSPVAGLEVDAGAEAFLARDPAAVELAGELGLALVHPATSGAGVWSRGELRPLPAGTVLGIPGDLAALARSGVLSEPGLARVPLDLLLPGDPPADDVAVGRLAARRLGREVVDRLVDPLLGGVYAGRADALSLDATVPALAVHAHRERSLLRATVRARTSGRGAGPVFAAPAAGLTALTVALADCVARHPRGTVRTGTTVRTLERTPTGWRLAVGAVRDGQSLSADAVVVALPAAHAARLLGREVPAAAAELAAVESASVAVVTLAWPREAFPVPLTGTGFLVPSVEGRAVKAVTFSSRKWAHLAVAGPDVEVLRASLGRYGEEHALQRPDEELAALAVVDLAGMLGVSGRPLDVRVTRWGGALPQYAVGHLGRVRRVRAAVADQPALAVCGAAYDGVGVPAVLRSARRAAREVLARPGRGTLGA